MKNKARAIIGFLMLSTVLTACSTQVVKPAVEPTTAEVTATPTEEPTEIPTATPTATPTPSVAPQEADSLSENYVDFDNMSILINGHKYTFNESTLQDMIDNEVPFVDISNANNNIRPNYESETFEIVIDDEHLAYVAFSNFTDENRSINECPLSYINFDVIDNEVIKLSCPFDLTPEQLVENAGEASNVKRDEIESGEVISEEGHYDDSYEAVTNVDETYEYTTLSEKYLGDHGYYFKFHNGVLYNYTVTYR